MEGNTVLKLIKRRIPTGLDVEVRLCKLDSLHEIVPSKKITVVVIATRIANPTHWVFIIITKDEGCFFDPLADATPGPVCRLLSGCCMNTTYSKTPTQKQSSSCGHIVTYIACKLLQGLSKNKSLSSQIEQLNKKSPEISAGVWLRGIHDDESI